MSDGVSGQEEKRLISWLTEDGKIRGSFGGSKRQAKHAVANCGQTISLMLPPGEYKQGVESTCHSDSVFLPNLPNYFVHCFLMSL